MKVSELRIGNFCKRLDNTDFKISGKDISQIDDYPIELRPKPIPLTEEWLFKFGFFVKNFDYTIPISECEVVWLTLIPQHEACTSYSVCVTQIDEDELDQNVFLSDISYVHQLQNLYFALTGEELEIK